MKELLGLYLLWASICGFSLLAFPGEWWLTLIRVLGIVLPPVIYKIWDLNRHDKNWNEYHGTDMEE